MTCSLDGDGSLALIAALGTSLLTCSAVDDKATSWGIFLLGLLVYTLLIAMVEGVLSWLTAKSEKPKPEEKK